MLTYLGTAFIMLHNLLSNEVDLVIVFHNAKVAPITNIKPEPTKQEVGWEEVRCLNIVNFKKGKKT